MGEIPKMSRLQMRAIAGELEGKIWPLDESLIVIGRGTGCRVRLSDVHVSRRHCEIRREDGVMVLYDHESRNPTLHNGQPLPRAELNAGDIITICTSRFYIEPFTQENRPAEEEAQTKPSSVTQPLSKSKHIVETFDASSYAGNIDAVEQLFELFALSRALARAETLEELISTLEANVRARLTSASFWLGWHVEDEEFVLYSPATANASEKAPVEAFRKALATTEGVLLSYHERGGFRYVLAAPLLYGGKCFAVIAIESHHIEPTDCASVLEYLVSVADCAAPLVRAVERLEQLRRDASRLANGVDDCAVLLGDSQAMVALRAALRQAARAHGNVLLLGETGVGKELAARYVHDNSSRADGPYVVVNCAAIPAALFESEVFGYTAGAFTGAGKGRRGLFQIAHGGSLFLDEIGELTPENQARLLRAVESGVFRPLGSNDELSVNVRVIGATNRPLRDPASGFRPDLLHRVGTFVIELPPLRNRRDDVPILARHFFARFSVHAPSHLAGFTQDALSVLQANEWSGNVRELRNTIERACQCAQGPLITPSDLASPSWSEKTPTECHEFQTLSEHEKQYICRVFEKCEGNIAEAARTLGVARSTLYYKLALYGIRP
ncbi:MAG: sigma 54-interacting transcriptional regulator [Candidatus Hydrogenedentes bacterium]|nr:sigma 54-interacting transcriptional regulator [Candidatus Hydrogenedentota bacterium]